MDTATPVPAASPGSGWFDLWGASEWIALIGLVITVIGIGLALWALNQTKQLADAAARDARRILENELAAHLDLEPDETHGQLVSRVGSQTPEGISEWDGRARNIGHYRAINIKPEITYDGEPVDPVNFPSALPPTAIGSVFRFRFRARVAANRVRITASTTVANISTISPAEPRHDADRGRVADHTNTGDANAKPNAITPIVKYAM